MSHLAGTAGPRQGEDHPDRPHPRREAAPATRYAVFLRAINGSPRNRLSMADLRHRVEQCGFADVTSYLPTGNVVLSDPLGGPPSDVAARLDQGLATTGLVRTDAVVWRLPELLALVASDPFTDQHPHADWRRCASFLRSPPGRDGQTELRARGAVVLRSDDRVVLTAFPRSWTSFDLRLEHAYQVSATTRWWNVVDDFAHEHLS